MSDERWFTEKQDKVTLSDVTTWHEEGLVGTPPVNSTYVGVTLPEWRQRGAGCRTDVVRNAARSAENTGSPQRIVILEGESVVGVEVLLPEPVARRSLLRRRVRP